MSGYVLKITAFLPTGADAASHVGAYMKISGVKEDMQARGFVEIEAADRFMPHRKSASPGLPHGEGTTQEAPEENASAPAHSSGADLEMPGFLKRG